MYISKYVGLDVHKDTISVAYAVPGREDPVSHGVVPNTPKALQRLISKLSPDEEAVSFCYEAGPCGYGVYRAIEEAGHSCVVVAPSLVPRRPGDRVKTDRRDALSLARQHRSGDLTPVWVPGPEQEAMRDLLRARDDMKGIELRARQRLSAFLLRHGRVYGRSRWTQGHFRWLAEQKFGQPSQQIVMQEYVNAVQGAQAHVAQMDVQIREAVQEWSLRPTVEALMALRGVDLLCAATLLAELGDISRFDNPRQLMGFVGLVPSEHSSGSRRRKGAITKTGNGRVRRILIEAAWSYRFPARKTLHMRQKGELAPPEVQAIAWKAQKRLCGRFRRLDAVGKVRTKVATAVARELLGFVWAVVREAVPAGSRADHRMRAVSA